MKQKYVDRRFQKRTMKKIEMANQIIEEYQKQGLDMTLRQIHYQFVARGLGPNTKSAYDTLGDTLVNARLAGLVDWDAICDRTRFKRGHAYWATPESVIRSAAYGYREQKWWNQPVRIEAWIEKDALVGVIEGVCGQYEIDYFACRGFTSLTSTRQAAERFIHYNNNDQKVIVLHLGDHDPSGMDCTRDIENRLHILGADVEIRRIALNMDQVERYEPPPNFAKMTDSRAAGYVEEFGVSSWELDALDPVVLREVIETEVVKEIDQRKWDQAYAHQEDNRDSLNAVSEHWTEVTEWLANERDE